MRVPLSVTECDIVGEACGRSGATSLKDLARAVQTQVASLGDRLKGYERQRADGRMKRRDRTLSE